MQPHYPQATEQPMYGAPLRSGYEHQQHTQPLIVPTPAVPPADLLALISSTLAAAKPAAAAGTAAAKTVPSANGNAKLAGNGKPQTTEFIAERIKVLVYSLYFIH